MNATHSPAAITSWLGDSVGSWENDTLVIETKYLAPSSAARLNARYVFLVSPQTVVVERFTRVSDNELNYVFTVGDPTFYRRPWTGETHLLRSKERMFEYACHEGNYSMRNVLLYNLPSPLEALFSWRDSAEASPSVEPITPRRCAVRATGIRLA